MPEIIEHDGIPVVVGREKYYPLLRIHVRPRKLKDKSFKNMNKQQREALQNIAEMGIERKKEAVIAADYSEHNALSTANRLLQSKPIVDALRAADISDKKIAETIAAGLKAPHPLSKDGNIDYNAVAKFVREANTILDNYPAKKIQIDERSMVLHLTKEDALALSKFNDLRSE